MDESQLPLLQSQKKKITPAKRKPVAAKPPISKPPQPTVASKAPPPNRKRARPAAGKGGLGDGGPGGDVKASGSGVDLKHDGTPGGSDFGSALLEGSGADAAPSTPAPAAAPSYVYRGKWKNPLKSLLYSFGEEEVNDSSVDLLEDIVAEFLNRFTDEAVAVACRDNSASATTAALMVSGQATGGRVVVPPELAAMADPALGGSAAAASAASRVTTVKEKHLLFLTRNNPYWHMRIKDLIAKDLCITRLRRLVEGDGID